MMTILIPVGESSWAAACPRSHLSDPEYALVARQWSGLSAGNATRADVLMGDVCLGDQGVFGSNNPAIQKIRMSAAKVGASGPYPWRPPV